MELELRRDDFNTACTIGKLYADGIYACESLEDRVREVDGQPVASWKIKGETAIPRGRYRVVVNHSQRFGRELPQLLEVPGFEGIRIHPGNTAANTEGCILVGTERGPDSVLHSRDAFAELFTDIQGALAGGEQVWITVA